MPMRLAIDDTFDFLLADELARRESFNKHLFRPNTYLHKWWARRCGTTFRLILKHLVKDPARADYYAPGGLDGCLILDPMMGGGTTVHEAIRMGANVVGMDLDPIPVVQARAALSYVPLTSLQEAFDTFHDALRKGMSDLFLTTCPVCGVETEAQFVLHGWRKTCGCGPVLCVDSLVLRHEPDGSTWTLCSQCGSVSRNGRCDCNGNPEGSRARLVEKGAVHCACCGEPYREDLSVPFHRRYVPLAVKGRCDRDGLFFKTPSTEDLDRQHRADRMRPLFRPAKDFGVKSGPKSGELVRRGIGSYLELFSSRQLLYLKHAIASLASMEPPIRLNLGLLVSTSLEFNSMLCGYKGGNKSRPGAIRHTFSHHAYSIPYTALENNPLFPAKTSGTLQGLFHARILRARSWALRPTERAPERSGKATITLSGETNFGTEVHAADDLGRGTRRFLIRQASAASIPLASHSVDHVVTDPPYFDSVQYSDLGAFFRVWLQRLLPGYAVWRYDPNDAAVETRSGKDDGQYAEMLAAIFSECKRVLKRESGRLVFTFHHGHPGAWNALTLALRRAGFMLVNRYIVHSENVSSVHIVNLKAIRHDAILVAAPRGCGINRHWELPAKVDGTDSRMFCESCATALGWMLESELSEQEIATTWVALMCPS